MNLEEMVARGMRAEAFQASEPYQAAYQTAMSNLALAWMDVEDREHRDEIWRQIQALRAIDQQLTNIVDDGEVAMVELEQERK